MAKIDGISGYVSVIPLKSQSLVLFVLDLQ